MSFSPSDVYVHLSVGRPVRKTGMILKDIMMLRDNGKKRAMR